MRHTRGALLVATALLMTALSTVAAMGPASARPTARHHPQPSAFTHGRVDNRWFPLRPGTRWVLRGFEDDERTRDVVLASYRIRKIDGVWCRVVKDRVYADGVLQERTSDYYAMTRRGTVWYFGEDTAELNRHGQVVSREGSWRSGRDGAEAGVFMPAHPRVGQSFKQEDYPGHAEDRFRVLSLDAKVRTPLVASTHAMLTREWTPLEPKVVDHKYYVRDIGTVREQTVRGGRETLRLTRFQHVRR
jgi:hypothetical protein